MAPPTLALIACLAMVSSRFEYSMRPNWSPVAPAARSSAIKSWQIRSSRRSIQNSGWYQNSSWHRLISCHLGRSPQFTCDHSCARQNRTAVRSPVAIQLGSRIVGRRQPKTVGTVISVDTSRRTEQLRSCETCLQTSNKDWSGARALRERFRSCIVPSIH